jgi:anti-sigma regulatory factor (Ser/Thr protein kinase)
VTELPEYLRALLRRRESISASDLAEAAGVSRQAAHRFLSRLVERGELVREGRARATRYRTAPRKQSELTYRRTGLQEDRVWDDVRQKLPDLGPDANAIAHYAVTELVNNAIDHSSAKTVEVRIRTPPDAIQIDILDDGVGVFAHLKQQLHLEDELHAIQELHKGKLTTMPERHTGEGIFFVSKAVDLFEIDSSGLVWLVDNQRADVAVMNASPRRGSRVGFTLTREPKRSLEQLFAEYTGDSSFSRSRTSIKLFTLGVRFVSRSEAKRLLHGLEKFREVTLDFAGVQGVGQGFADEVFRVWAREHPTTTLVPVNMARTVETMVRRALHG